MLSRVAHDQLLRAFAEGKTVQSRVIGTTIWKDCVYTPKNLNNTEYRIKPEEDVTIYPPDKYDKWIEEELPVLVDKPDAPQIVGNKITTITTDLHVPGAKDDASKPPVALVFESFPRALLEVAKVAGYGCQKYTRGGWKTVPDAITRYSDAGARHELYRHIEGETDPESGLLHLAHQAWNVLATLEKTLEEA